MTELPADITAAQLANVYVVARRRWPFHARYRARKHNQERHDGRPTAHIDPEPARTRGVPKYCVWCPVCEGG